MPNRFKFSKEFRAKEKKNNTLGIGLFGCHLGTSSASYEYMMWMTFDSLRIVNRLIQKLGTGMSLSKAFWQSKPEGSKFMVENGEDLAAKVFNAIECGGGSIEAFDPEGTVEVDIIIDSRCYRLHIEECD